jgi:Leucine-rich repeat (LRR) protein
MNSIIGFVVVNLIYMSVFVSAQSCPLYFCTCLNDPTLYSMICTKKLDLLPSLNSSFELAIKKNISIVLKNQNYSSLPNYIFKNLSITSLELSNCEIVTIQTNAFIGIETKLQVLNLRSNKLSNIANIFNGLIYLEKLFLDSNQIKQINHNDLCNLTQLKMLSLSSNLIRTISNFKFACLYNLKYLSLRQNRIDFLQNVNMTPIQGSMVELDFSQNDLMIIKNFQMPSFLSTARFSRNKLENICDMNFTHQRIFYFDFNYNLLTSIECINFNEMVNIESFLMDFNLIKSIDFIDFTKLNNLKLLSFRHNKITYVKNLDLRGSNKLQSVIFSENSLKSLKNFRFPSKNQIELLDFQSNQIETINEINFEDFLSLKFLYLNKNLLKTIEFNASLASLSYLDLAENQLKILDLKQAHNLNGLDLSKNPLDSIYMANMKKLSVFFAKNSLQKIDLSFCPNLRSLDLSENPHIELNFSLLTRLTFLDFSSNNFSSVQSLNLNNFTNLVQLNLSSNKLDSIEAIDFLKINKLKDLTLSWNNLRNVI